MDIKAIEHKSLLTHYNNIDEYFFWTQEAMVFTLLLGNRDTYGLSDFEVREFISVLLREKGNFLVDTKFLMEDIEKALIASEKYAL